MAEVSAPIVSVAAALARPVNVIQLERSVTGAVSLMRLLFWVWSPVLLLKLSVVELSSMALVLRIDASSCSSKVLPERTVRPP